MASRRKVASVGLIALVIVAGVATLSVQAFSTNAAQDSIVEVAPYSASLKAEGIDAISAEVRRRLDQWSEDVSLNTLSDPQLVSAIDAVTNAISTRGETYDWLWLRELMYRREALCQRLSAGHEYVDEYC